MKMNATQGSFVNNVVLQQNIIAVRRSCFVAHAESAFESIRQQPVKKYSKELTRV